MRINYSLVLIFYFVFFFNGFSQENSIDLKLANTYYLNGDYEKAILYYDRLSENENNLENIYQYYKSSLVELKEFKSAEKLCKRLQKKNKNIYLDKKVLINHLGGSSHNEKINFEMELSRNWHWMWSTFYYNKKYYGYYNSLFKVSGKFFSALVKLIFYSLMFNKIKKKIYYQRFSGLFNSIIGRNSWYRPN